MTTRTRTRKCRSKCGQYIIPDVDAPVDSQMDLDFVRIEDGCAMKVVMWSNHGTTQRYGCSVVFADGSEAAFSWPRHRGGVVKRWVVCFGVDYQMLHEALVAAGVIVEKFDKPDWNCHIHLRLRGKVQVIDDTLGKFAKSKDIYSRRPNGAWDIY